MKMRYLGLGALLAIACNAGQANDEPHPATTVRGQAGGQSGTLPRVAPAQQADGIPTLAPLIEAVRPTVVGVTTRVDKGAQADSRALDDFWRRFFGEDVPHGFGPPPSPRQGIGSGVIIDAAGLVITNNHVVEGADEVRVRTADEKEYTAEVVGRDPETDIAVLRLQDVEGQLPAARLGSSDSLRVGDFVVAIGNPFGLELTVTSGIISAKARIIGAGPYDDFLQTDAAINPGNSGGPLFDLRGNVVGINTAIVATGAGIGFAVPVDLIRGLLPQLLEAGRVVRGYLGVAIQDLTPELAEAMNIRTPVGALVASIETNAPAEGKLQVGDVVLAVEGERVDGAAALSRRVAQFPPGKEVLLRVLRDGKERNIRVPLGERPSSLTPQLEGEDQDTEGALGLALQDLPPELARQLGISGGALIADLRPGSRAAEAGLIPGDVIVQADRQEVRSASDLAEIVRRKGNDALLLRIIRDGTALFVVVPPARGERQR